MDQLTSNKNLSFPISLPSLNNVFFGSKCLGDTHRLAFATDLAILTGNDCAKKGNYCSKERPGLYYTSTFAHGYYTRGCAPYDKPEYEHAEFDHKVWGIDKNGGMTCFHKTDFAVGIRPQIYVDEETVQQLLSNSKTGYANTIEVQMGEYPQFVLDYEEGQALKKNSKAITETDRQYHFYQPYSSKISSFQEFQMGELRFIKIQNTLSTSDLTTLSNSVSQYGSIEYLKVEPITWYLDIENDGTGILTSKNVLLSGVPFDQDKLNDNFKATDMYQFLNSYMKTEMLASSSVKEKTYVKK